jgi:hypothetical protein
MLHLQSKEKGRLNIMEIRTFNVLRDGILTKWGMEQIHLPQKVQGGW